MNNPDVTAKCEWWSGDKKSGFTTCPGLAATHGSGVPDGYQLLAQTDIICAGDIVADFEGKWRGPVTHDWPGCGRPVSEYTVSKSGIGLPAVRGVARKHLPNAALSGVERKL